MKRNFKFMALVLLGIMLSINQVWAESPASWSHNGTASDKPESVGEFSIAWAKGNAGTAPTGYAESVRLYAAKNGTGNIITISTSEDGVYITRIDLTGTVNQGTLSFTWSGTTASTGNYYATYAESGKVQSVTCTLKNTNASKTGQFRLTGISITYASAGGSGKTTVSVSSVANGTITATPAGGSAITEGNNAEVSKGTSVALSATADPGYVFGGWNLTNATASDASAASTSFTMGTQNVTVSATFNAAPVVPTITTISDLFTTATSTGTTAKDIKLTLNSWVVTAVTSASGSTNNVFVTDGTNGFIINGASTGFAVGNQLSGTAVACQVKQDGNRNTIVTGLSTSNVTATAGGSVEPIETSLSSLNSGLYTGSVRTITGTYQDQPDGATSHKYIVADGHFIWLGNTIYSYGEMVEGTQYTITGVYWMNGNAGDNSHRIMPREASEIRDNRWTITWSVNGNTSVVAASKFNPGAAITFPNAAAVGEVDCNGKVFVGWSDKSSVNSSTGDLVTSATATGNKTYYAVFATSEGGGGSTNKSFEITSQDISATSYSSTETTFSKDESYSFGYTQVVKNQNGTPSGWCSNQVIQTRSTNDPKGLYNKTEMNLTSVVVYIASPTAGTNTWEVYGGSDAENPTETTVEKTAGDAINIKYDSYASRSCTSNGGDATEKPYTCTFSSGTKYFTFKSTNGAMYVTRIVVNYTEGGGASYSDYSTECVSLPEYAVTFNNGGKGTLKNTNGDYSRVTLAQMDGVTGYHHEGWKADVVVEVDGEDVAAGTQISHSVTVTVKEATTFTAVWGPNQHQLKWITDGDELTGEYTKTGSVAYGTTIVAPETPTKTGYTFNSWSPSVPETMPDENVTLTATWTINNYAITWMVSGEEWSGKGGSTGADYNTSIASVATAPESDACDEKVFMGWTDVEIDGETDTEPTLYKVLGDFPVVTAATTYYAVFADRNSGGGTVNDVLNRETTGVEEGTTYSDWSNKTVTSSAVYAGQSAGEHNTIQLRSKNNNSGIITTTSGGTLSSVSVVFEGNTASGRVLNVYGKNTAYSAASDLFDDATAGTLLGTIVNGTSTSLDITGSYEYVGVRSNDAAIYLTSITFSWGSDSYSGYVTSCTEKPALDAPTGLTVSNLSSRSVTLSWTTVEHAETYVVTINGTKKDPISGTSIDLSDLTPGTLYSWSVTAQADGYKKATADGENFTTKREFTLTYHSNGSTGGKSPVTGGKTTVIEGEQHTILGNIGDPKLTKAGYTFAGWHNSTTYSATPYYTIGQAIDVTGNITIYANWEPKQDKYVDDMHGVVIDAAVTQGAYSAPHITSAGTSYNDCETGHTVFIGWIKAEVGVSGTNEAPDGLVHAGDAVKADSSTYHAVWAEED